jgi:hypothetical protein
MLSFPIIEDFRDAFVEPFDSPTAALAHSGRASREAPRVSPPVANGAPAQKIFSGMFARRPLR